MLRFVFMIMLACWTGIAAAQPLLTPDAAVMKLDELGLYTVGYAYRGQPEQAFPLGWSGDFDDQTGVACRPAGEQAGRPTFLLHCPWRNGTGITFQQFRFAVPKARRVILRGATAMRADIVGQSDGATFRVYADGRKLLDVNRTDAAWLPFAFDLTSYAGRTLTLRFETDPGPKDNPSFDFSLWGGRELILEGYRPNPIIHPAPPRLDLRRLMPVQRNGAVPSSGFTGRVTSAMEDNTAVYRYDGPDGTLEYRWTRPTPESESLFGPVVLRARMRNDRTVEVPLAASSRLDWTWPVLARDSRWETRPGRNSADGYTLARIYQAGDRTATVRIHGHMIGKSLVFTIVCDTPLTTMMDAGGWGPTLRRRSVTVPYYTGQVFFLPHENLFVNTHLDWTTSAATSHEGARAHYGSLTDGTRNGLKERVIYTAAWHMAETLPNIPNPPSPFRQKLAGKIMLDIWGGRYADIARGFEMLSDYGITNCAVIIHDWQRSGYDNALPAHIPAEAGKGGDEGMKVLVSTGTRLGYDVSLHENYVDYYPNYEGYTEKDIALDSTGKPQNAWYNPGTKIQSFAVKPNAILPLAATQSPEIHRRYGTNANYLDVHSAVPPWFHVDMRAGETGAGAFARVWEVHRALWDYERRTHHGPVFGEGNNHWYWSGLLDGVEAQFGSGWPGGGGLTAPLAVDFDVLKIHPLQFNHGMGYYERWWSDAMWGGVPPLVILDQYRMQEVAYGHMGFLAGSVWNNLPLAWLEHHLLTPVTARYAYAKPADILYQVNGLWVDGTQAAKAGDWRRVRVLYDNGLTVTANNAEAPLTVSGIMLPRFGWLATGAGVMAWTALRGGVTADYAATKTSVFANARNAGHWNLTGVLRIRPKVSEFAQTGPRAFRATYNWSVKDRPTHDYSSFVHFGRPGPDSWDEGIRFQQDHPLPKPAREWTPGETVTDGPHSIVVPENVPDGVYEWTIGLFSPSVGRASIEGKTDRHGRVRLGVIRMRDGGQTITFEPEKDTGTDRLALYSRNMNATGRVVDFGTLRTNGSVMVRRVGRDWELQTFPREKPFTLEMSVTRFGQPSQIRCEGGDVKAITPIPARGQFWRLPLNGSRTYRWPARESAGSR